jgi:hypothetical protein
MLADYYLQASATSLCACTYYARTDMATFDEIIKSPARLGNSNRVLIQYDRHDRVEFVGSTFR